MICRKYTNRDFEQLRDWYNKRGMKPLVDLIPPVGFIVPGVGAGFMMSTDTSCCILEPFVTNPDAPKEYRDAALTLIMQDLIQEAYSKGFTRIFGFSTNSSMVSRALDLGFKITEKGGITVLKELE